MNVTAPPINWAGLAPAIIVLGAGVLGVLVETFVARRARLITQATLAVLAILAAGVAVVVRWDGLSLPGDGAPVAGLTEDPFALAAQGILLIIGFLAVLVMADPTTVGDSAFTAQAADRPGSAEESESIHAQWRTKIGRAHV